jgi:hypothetical protein
MEDALSKQIQEIKETLIAQTELIGEQRKVIDKQNIMIDALCSNYQAFIEAVALLDLPDEIHNRMVETQILLEQIKS